MRDCIVDVQNVQVIDFRYFRHARGQRQVIWRILKQRILRHRDFMKEDAWLLGVEADGLLVSDEMHFMATLRQLNAEFRAHHSAAAVGGITGYSDLHLVMPLRSRPLTKHPSTLASPALPLPARRHSGLAGFQENIKLRHFASVAKGYVAHELIQLKITGFTNVRRRYTNFEDRSGNLFALPGVNI